MYTLFTVSKHRPGRCVDLSMCGFNVLSCNSGISGHLEPVSYVAGLFCEVGIMA